MARRTRPIVLLVICVAACKGESRDNRAAPKHDAALQPSMPLPDVPIVASTVTTAPLPRQQAGVIAIDGRGQITTADVVSSWDGRMPAVTMPLVDADLEKLWLDDWLGERPPPASYTDDLTPAKWRAAKQRRKADASRVVFEAPAVGSATSHLIRATVRVRSAAPDDASPDLPAILASANAPAHALAHVAILRGGMLIVDAGSTLRTLVELSRYAGPSAPARRPWLELQLDDRGVEIMLIPATRDESGSDTYQTKLVAWGQLDRAALQAGLAMGAAPPDVDLVVGDGATVQKLVDVIALLDSLGVRTFGVAERPVERHTQSLGREWIRRFVRRHDEEFSYCYEFNFREKPSLAGTVTTSFRILPDGRITEIEASGVDADVADCIALVLERIRFPAFDDPVGLRVNYPFTLRPASP